VPPLVRYRQLGNWLFDCASFVEGRDGLRRLLLEQVVGQGGDAHPGQQITEIIVKKGRLSGVSLAGKNESVGCQVILTSLTPSEISSYIQPASWTRRFQDAVADCPPPMRGYALNLGVEKEVVPEGLADTAFLTNGPGLGEQLLRIEKIPQKDETRAALHVACIVPRGDEPAIETGALRDALLDRIRALVPFLDNALEVIHSPFDGFGPIDLKGGAKGPAPPVPHKEEVTKWLLRPPPQAGPLGVGNLPHRTGIKGLLLAGDQVVSGLGLEGELLAAWGAARIAGKMDPRRERLLRSMRSKVEM
jgi:phytoene dehydrogenase-like protein